MKCPPRGLLHPILRPAYLPPTFRMVLGKVRFGTVWGVAVALAIVVVAVTIIVIVVVAVVIAGSGSCSGSSSGGSTCRGNGSALLGALRELPIMPCLGH